MPQQISEAGALRAAAGHTWRALLIEGERWGSSGFYSREVLERDGAETWPIGTHVFLDHPGAEEKFDRPERSVRDLAGRIISTPIYETGGPDGEGLYADIAFYSHTAPIVAEMAEDVGMSIRASASVETGEAQGRRGQIVTALHEGRSVDVVTRAGAGGKLVQLLESARTDITEARNIGQWIESRIHRDFTYTADDMAGDGRLTREERIGLSSAIGDALQSFVSRLEADHPQLYTRDLWEDPQDTIAAAIEAATKNVPVIPAGQSTTTESKEDTMPQIEESELAQLREASGRVTALETQLAESETARQAAVDEARASRDTARTARINTIIAEADHDFDDLQAAGLRAQAQVDESGVLDETAFTTTVNEAAARIAEANGAGRPRGNGQRTNTSDETVSEADLDKLDADVFGEIKEG